MNLETFLKKFDQFADTPDAVTKMRELLIDLAVSGKLVPNDPLEDPIRVGPRECPSFARSVPANWRSGTLGDFLSFEYGDNLPAPKRTESGEYPVYGSNGIVGTHNTYLTPDPAIIIGRKGSAGALNISTGPSWTIDVAYFVRPPKDLDLRFTYYLLASLHLEELGKGIKPGLSRKEAYSLLVIIPPLAEQKRIVARVDELMRLCDRMEEQQKEREMQQVVLSRAAIARFDEAPTPANLSLLFHGSYFIAPADLRKTILNLAVRGELVPQDPDEESAKVALERLGLHCANHLEIGADSEDSVIPESWSRVRFEDVAVIVGGVTLGRKLNNRKTVTLPYLRVANVKRGEIDVSVMKEVAIAEDEIDRYALAEGDLLLTEGGDWDKVGRAAIWDGRISPCLHQNHIFRARMRSLEIAPYWFERYFNSPLGRAYFESASKQTTNLASINMRQVRACLIPFPPIAEQNRIILKLDQLMALVNQLETQLATSDATARKLLDAAIHELLYPRADVIESPRSSRDRASDRAAIGCYAIQRLAQSPNFGRVMLMKVCYLSETHLGLSLGWQPVRQAAGPYDPEIEKFEFLGKCSDWFTLTEKSLNNGHTKVEYHAQLGLKAKAAEAITMLGNQRAEFDRLLNLFADKSTEQAEIIATLFATWNDFLIDGKSPSNDEIIREVRENWHPKKERFTQSLLARWLKWLYEHRLIPKGNPPRTRQQLSLALSGTETLR